MVALWVWHSASSRLCCTHPTWPHCPTPPAHSPSPPPLTAQVPKSVASQLQSSNLEFIDVIEYNPAFISASPYRIFVRTESPFLKDKLDVRMTMTIEEAEGGAACRQVGGARQGACGGHQRWGHCCCKVLGTRRVSVLSWQFPARTPSPQLHPHPRPHCHLPPPVQILEGHIRVKMFGVGRIVEGIVKDSLQNVRCAGLAWRHQRQMLGRLCSWMGQAVQ